MKLQPCGYPLLLGHFFSYKAGLQWAEKAMATHSSTLAWKIPWTEEPGGLQSMGSLRVGHDSATSLSLFTFMHWRRKWQPTPVFLAWRIPGTGSLMGCHLWGRTESDTTEETQQQQGYNQGDLTSGVLLTQRPKMLLNIQHCTRHSPLPTQQTASLKCQ